MRTWVTLVLASLCAFAPAACGGGDESEDASGATRVEVTLSDFSIEPGEIELDTAGTYAFVARNEGSVDHAFEVEGDDLEEETAEIAPGETGVLTVRLSEGRYKIYCPIGDHESRGMVGSLVVGSG